MDSKGARVRKILQLGRRQLRWILPLLLLVLVHELGSNAAGQKIENEADWPSGAANQPDLKRGIPIDLYWAVQKDPERAGGLGAGAALGDEGGESEDGEDGEDGEESAVVVKPEGGVLVDIHFIYNPSLHAVVLMICCAFVAAWLVRVHPIWVLPALVYTSAKVDEFYPVTDWPMYSNPSMGPSWYCYLADGEGTALPVRELCGETAPKLKKRMRSYTTEMLSRDEYEQFSGRDDLPDEAWEQCAERVLYEMMARSEEEGHADHLPPRLQLIRVDIYQQDGGFKEVPQVLGEVGTASVTGLEDEADSAELKEVRENNVLAWAVFPSNSSLNF